MRDDPDRRSYPDDIGEGEGDPPARRDIILCCCDDQAVTDNDRSLLALYLLEYRRRRVYEFSEECLTEHLWISSSWSISGIPLRHKHEFTVIPDITRVPRDDKDSLRLAVFPSATADDSDLIIKIWRELKIPVLVNADNHKDKQLVKDAGGGLWYDKYYEFEGALDYILSDMIRASHLACSGNAYACGR